MITGKLGSKTANFKEALTSHVIAFHLFLFSFIFNINELQSCLLKKEKSNMLTRKLLQSSEFGAAKMRNLHADKIGGGVNYRPVVFSAEKDFVAVSISCIS